MNGQSIIYRIFVIIYISLLAGFYLQCDSVDFTAPGPQPSTIEKTEYEPGLDVFGVLRPDSMNGLPRSFVHLEFAYPAGDEPDSTLVTDAVVIVYGISGAPETDSVNFTYTDFGDILTFEYRHPAFSPQSGIYGLICRRAGYPDLTAQTTMPGRPAIRGDIERKNDQLLFTLIRDERAGLYEIILDGYGWQVRDRVLRPAEGDVSVALSLPRDCAGPCLLSVNAYDLNLSEYLTSNLSIKPNIYQADFSTVTGGYGCFGSLNILEREMEL